MERNVVSLETAKRLKAAGFPQKNAYSKYLRVKKGWRLSTKSSLLGEEDYAAPTAQEIADQLPTMRVLPTGNGYLQTGPVHGPLTPERWWAAYETPQGPDLQFIADTMAEALAALYLKLQETK